MRFSKFCILLLLGIMLLIGCKSDKKNPAVVKDNETVVQEKKKKKPIVKSTPESPESTISTRPPTRIEVDRPDNSSISSTPNSQSSMVNAINSLRRKGCKCGGRSYPPVPSLRWNSKLATAATNHSKLMARSKKLSHGNISSNLKRAGYYYTDAAQNISNHASSYNEVLTFWLKSSKNCADIMKPSFKDIGLGFANGYWTQLLGKQMDGGSSYSSTGNVSSTSTNPKTSSSSNNSSYTAPISNLKNEMLTSVNALRKKGCSCGSKFYPSVPALRWSSVLETSARNHAQDMAKRNLLTHDGSDGSKVATRAIRAGYNYRSLGENVSKSKPSVRSAVASWQRSPQHCANMMNHDFTEIGAAKVGAYWAQNFGRPMK